MNFETMNTIDNEKKITNPEQGVGEEINTAELADKFLKDQKALDELSAKVTGQDQAEYKKTLESIDATTAEKPEAKNEAERKAHRQEFIKTSLQKMIDNLQTKVDKTGLRAMFTPKDEIKADIDGLKQIQGKNNDQIYWEYYFAYPAVGKFVDKSVQKEILAAVKAEFDSEDQALFEGNEKVRKQIGHQLTDVSAG